MGSIWTTFPSCTCFASSVSGDSDTTTIEREWQVSDLECIASLQVGAVSGVGLYKDVITGDTVVAKICNYDTMDYRMQYCFRKQCEILQNLVHPNLMHSIAQFAVEGFRVIVMPYAEKGDLLNYVQDRRSRHLPVSTDMLLIAMADVLEALAHMHAHGYVHRDVKAENILLEKDGVAKLTDFDLAVKIGNKVMCAGTDGYMAPEILQCKRTYHQTMVFNESVDVFAVGATLYALMSNTFADPYEPKFNKKIFSKNAQSWLTAAMHHDPAKRATVQQLLEHPWIVGARQRKTT